MKTLLCTLMLAAFGAMAAEADIVITFDDPNQIGTPGETLKFFGTISDTDTVGSPAEYLNSDDPNLAATPDLTLIDLFFTNVPIFLTPGTNSGDIELFDVIVGNPLLNPEATYPGSYDLSGGQDGGDGSGNNLLASASFSVATVPEPSALILLATMLGAAGFLARRQTKRG